MLVSVILLIIPAYITTLDYDLIAKFDKALNITDLSQCEIQIQPIGCYEDKTFDRAFPREVINSRDSSSLVKFSPIIQWKNYPHFLANFICECAKEVLKRNKGNYIGVQFYGECWSANPNNGDVIPSFDKHGASTECVDGEYNDYIHPNKTKCQVYTGKENRNFVYKITKYADKPCPLYFESHHCYHDNQTDPRPLPDYLFNERDYTIPNWNGRTIDWQNWNTYLPGLLCRCAQSAKASGYTYFGIQFYGECWAGNDEVQFSRNGRANGRECMHTLGYKPYGEQCPLDVDENANKRCLAIPCAGVAQANKIYKLKQGPLACSGDPCKNGGTCQTVGRVGHVCACPTGFSGEDCANTV